MKKKDDNAKGDWTFGHARLVLDDVIAKSLSEKTSTDARTLFAIATVIKNATKTLTDASVAHDVVIEKAIDQVMILMAYKFRSKVEVSEERRSS